LKEPAPTRHFRVPDRRQTEARVGKLPVYACKALRRSTGKQTATHGADRAQKASQLLRPETGVSHILRKRAGNPSCPLVLEREWIKVTVLHRPPISFNPQINRGEII